MAPRRNKDSEKSDGHSGTASKLTVTAQQSRFHTEMDEDNTLKEIVVKDLSISIGNRELLSHADLQLQRGRKYILHGRNGIGKSTLLTAIATDQIPNIPRGVKVLLLGQVESEAEGDVATKPSEQPESVLQYVLRADRKRERLLREANQLSTAFEDIANPLAAVQVYRRISHERLEDKVAVARLLATRRSGARGAKSRQVLNQLEEELARSVERLSAEVVPDEMSEESRKGAEILAEVQLSLELMDAAGAESKARSVLSGLGFSPESIEQPRANLSGGWKTRCSLAAALCQSVDLLLLDEPTNYLDLPSIIWLENYIQEIDETTTVMVVTHDRAFGDGVAEELLVLRESQLQRFRGNLSQYEMDRLKTFKYLTRMKDAQDKQKKHIQASIDSNLQAARRNGDDKKLKQAASRKKKLDERMGMEVSAKGTRFKLNRDLAGYHLTNRAEIEPPSFDPPVVITIPTEPPDLRFPGSLVSLGKVNFSYTVGKKRIPILKDIDLTIHPGDRIGLCGLNGSGKSTLVSLIMAANATATPSSGTITRHTRARFGLYSQQSVEELHTLAVAEPQLTALSHLMSILGPSADVEKEARSLLSGVGLAGRVASDVPLGLLSGGQKVRLALAKLFCPTPPHLLVLDEVTTHLDTDTIQALVTALRRYQGAILLVTHDRFFMRCLIEGESMKALAARNRPMTEDGEDDESDEGSDDGDSSDSDNGTTSRRTRVIYRLSKGKLIKLDRGMEQYEEIAARSASKLGKA